MTKVEFKAMLVNEMEETMVSVAKMEAKMNAEGVGNLFPTLRDMVAKLEESRALFSMATNFDDEGDSDAKQLSREAWNLQFELEEALEQCTLSEGLANELDWWLNS
jgi:hypothetical protein